MVRDLRFLSFQNIPSVFILQVHYTIYNLYSQLEINQEIQIYFLYKIFIPPEKAVYK